MSTDQYELAPAPSGARAMELWLQHAAGFIIFEDARQYALDRLDPKLTPKARAAAEKAIDDAIYGIMMVLDGDSGSLSNATHKVELHVVARLIDHSKSRTRVKAHVDLVDGDGMCMGYHGWKEGDFGKDPIVIQS